MIEALQHFQLYVLRLSERFVFEALGPQDVSKSKQIRFADETLCRENVTKSDRLKLEPKYG